MKIDDNFTANKDTYGWTLTFTEERTRSGKDKVEEVYLYEDNTYHATLKQCLKKYMDLSLKGASSAEEVLGRIVEVEDRIDGLKI